MVREINTKSPMMILIVAVAIFAFFAIAAMGIFYKKEPVLPDPVPLLQSAPGEIIEFAVHSESVSRKAGISAVQETGTPNDN